MSFARGFGQNGKSLYTNITKPCYVDLQFTVTPTNGLGITSLKSNGYVRNVFMHTSTTPSSNDGALNPNPASGYALIQLTNNFNKFLSVEAAMQSPTTGSQLAITSGLTAGLVYVIDALGTTTTAEWQSIGLPLGLTPTVGQAFVATATGTGGSHTGKVKVPGSSGIASVEICGDPDQEIANASLAANGGAYVLVQFLTRTITGTVSQPTLTMNSYTPAGTNDSATPPIFTGTPATLTGTVSTPTFTSTSTFAAAAPTAGTVVHMRLCFDGSQVTVDGM